jgi:hypothetical protein
MRRGILVAVVLLAVLPLLRGDAPPAKPTIEQLIEQLGDKDFKVRQIAEKAIEELGPDALPALRKALEAKPTLDVSRRIEKWIPQFELAALSNPKTVTLSVTGRPLHEVVDQIAKQTGYPMAITADADRENKPHDFKFDRVPFWDALDAVCAAGEMLASRNPDQKGFQLQFSDKYQPFVHRHGAFRVVGQGFQYSYSKQRSNQFGLVGRKPAEGDKQVHKHEAESLAFTILVEAEPRVRVLGLGEVTVSAATDDQKQALAPDAAPNRMMFGRRHAFASAGAFGSIYLNAYVPLKAPAKDAKSVTLLKGTVPVHIEKEKKTTVLAEKILEAKGKKFKVGETSLEIDEVKKGDNDQIDLHMTATGGLAGFGEMDGELELLDEKGNPYQIAGSGSNSDGKTARMHLHFVPSGQAGPAKLVYTTHVTMDYVLPFEFRDLPLP